MACVLAFLSLACDGRVSSQPSQDTEAPSSPSSVAKQPPPRRYQAGAVAESENGWIKVTFSDTAASAAGGGQSVSVAVREGVSPAEAEALLNFVASLEQAAREWGAVYAIEREAPGTWVVSTSITPGSPCSTHVRVTGELTALQVVTTWVSIS